MFKARKWSSWISFLTLAVLTFAAAPALAHEAPDGSEWIMADWMFLSFMIFAGVAFVFFLVALKRGWLSDLEGEAKHYILQIEEEDYYSSPRSTSDLEARHES
ncbi:MAG: hypothetical protein KC547_08050 [Anaerolineae bacterium]|nr:hypothetical protein [Anaerolineae bacterium]MCA9910632.1 hypothetical protein [Anaerolineae bacterium]